VTIMSDEEGGCVSKRVRERVCECVCECVCGWVSVMV
jgi:hypothetical protein